MTALPPPDDRRLDVAAAVSVAILAALAAWVIADPAPTGRPDGRTAWALIVGLVALAALSRRA